MDEIFRNVGKLEVVKGYYKKRKVGCFVRIYFVSFLELRVGGGNST